MDEQREWLKRRKKKRLRILSVVLCFCILFTACPDIIAALSALAEEKEETEDILYISDFMELPMEIKEQTVPVGTELQELLLPDTLEVVVAVSGGGNPVVDAEEKTEGTGTQPGETEGTGTQPGETEGAENESGGGKTGHTGESDGDGQESVETAGQMPDGQEADANAEREEGQDTLSEPAEMKIESNIVTLPEYYEENVVAVEVLEKTEETATLEGIRWQSEPAYDGSVGGICLFTAVLPANCVLEEGVTLPQITVTVLENSVDPLVQALIDRIAVLPELDAYLAAEPESEAEEDYEIWMTALYGYAEESLAIWKEYHLLTEEQRMRIPEEAVLKLGAWAAFAEPFIGNGIALAAETHSHGGRDYTTWNSSTSLSQTEAVLALMRDVDLGSSRFEQTMDSQTQLLCLNGHTIQGTASKGVIRVNGRLQIEDCQGGGKVYGLEEHNPILVNNGTLWLQGGIIEAAQGSAIPIGDGSNPNNGQIIGYGGTVSGGTNGILVGSTGGSPEVDVMGMAVTGGECGINAKSGKIVLSSGSVSTSGPYAVSATDNATVRVLGNVTLSATTAGIYTTNAVTAGGDGVSGLTSVYTIYYEGVTDGTVVVSGSTDKEHYKLVDPSNTYVLVAEGGNLVARSVSPVTVTAYKDGAVWTDGAPVYQLSSDNGQTFITDFSAVPPGTYTIYEGDTSTGMTVTVAGGGDVSARLDYYTVTFYDGSTALTSPAPQIVRKGAKAAAPASLSKTGYTFRWVTADQGTTAFNFDSTIQAKTKVYAGWTAAKYTVSFNYQNATSGNTTASKQVTYDSAYGTLPAPQRTGYAFGGWYTQSGGGGTEVTTGTTVKTAGNHTLYAKWTANSYSVTLNGNGGSGTGLTSYTYGTGATLPTGWARTGYTFGGWYANSNCTGTAVTKITGTETGAKTFYAKWTANQYTITFDDQGATGGTGTTSKKVTYDSAYGALPAPQKTGYTLKGWYTQAGGGGSNVTAATTVKTAGDHTLYAYWKDETPPAAPALSNGTVLPGSWTTALSIPLTLQDGVGVTELWVKVDNGAYQKVNGFTGGTEYEFTGVLEGSHTYYFKAKDAAGNKSAESAGLTGKLDTTKPVIGSLTYDHKGGEGFSWIFGKKDLVIHVPVTENGSGTTQISYTMTPAGADGSPNAGSAQKKTADVKNGEAKISFSEDFKGTIAITCTDAAGNAADGVTIGASGGGVIVEDTAPAISVMADRGIADTAAGQPGSTALSEAYYESAPALSVTVTDDEKNQIVAGIASVTYQVGNGAEKKAVIDQSVLQSRTAFAIPDTEIPSGITTISITAKDNAGNEASAVYTVKVKGPEKLPAASIDYPEERLKNLIPSTEYSINGTAFTADAEGCVPIQETWFGTTVSIVKKGNGSMTIDSPAQNLVISARPQTPAPAAEDETGPNSRDGKLKNLNANTGYQISSDNGVTWQTVTSNGNGELTGCAPGEYAVRVCATESSFASRKSGIVKIAAYRLKIRFMANGTEYAVFSVDYGGNMTGIPAAPPKQNAGGRMYIGEWCDAQGNPAVFTNLTADMTVYAVYTPAYAVTLQGGMGYSISAAASANLVKEGGSFSFRILLLDGYRRTEGFAVRANGTAVTAAADGTYTIQGIRQDMTVTVEGVEKIPTSLETPGNSGTSGNGGSSSEGGASGGSGGSSSEGGASGGSSSSSSEGGASGGSGSSSSEGGASGGSGSSSSEGGAPGGSGGSLSKSGSPNGIDAITNTGTKNDFGTTTGAGTPGGIGGTTGTGLLNDNGMSGESDSAGGGSLRNSSLGDSADLASAQWQGSTKSSAMDGEEAEAGRTARVLAASVDDGRIVLPGGAESAGNAAGMACTDTILELEKGAVIVTVVCEEQEYGAGVSDAVSVVNSVLTSEQIQRANDGENIEIRIAVETIPQAAEQDKEVTEDCIKAYRKEIPELTVGMYLDISMFMKSGTGGWNAVAATEEPIEIVIGVPEELQLDGREYYIIRIHDGEYMIMSDLDDVPDTITICTDKFSCYAIAYRETAYGEAAAARGILRCRLCHKCPTFLGSCCFVWLIIITLEVVIAIILFYTKRKNRGKKQTQFIKT